MNEDQDQRKLSKYLQCFGKVLRAWFGISLTEND